MTKESNSPGSGFWTPMRVVTICAIIVAAIVVWLSTHNSGAPKNQPVAGAPSANPPATSGNAPNAPNTVASNAAPPTVAAVPLSDNIRQASVKTIDGGSIKLSDFKNKVLVVNLWATWCGPCRMEMPDLVKLNKEYKSRGLVVLGLATTYNEQDDVNRVKEFVKSQKVDYKILWDDGSLAQTLVQSVNGRGVIPQSFVISRDGKIVKHFSGFNPMATPTLMRQAVEDALADKSRA